MDEATSRTILFLKFVLIVAVVYIHTNLTDVNIGGNIIISEDEFMVHDTLRLLLSEEIARIAVPLFYFVSGYLFFNTHFSFKSYISKLRKRVHTLLIPYIFWNLLTLFPFFFAQQFFPSITSGNKKLIIDYGIHDWINVFWNDPICYPLWFLRDLMVVVLLSPLVYIFIKQFKLYGLVLLGILWCLGSWSDIAGFSITAFFFFAFGSYYAINRIVFIKKFYNLCIPFTIIYLLIITLNVFILSKHTELLYFTHNMGIIFGLISAISWIYHGITRYGFKLSKNLTNSSFFIYAFHAIPLMLFVKCYVKYVHPQTEFFMIIGYIFIPIGTILFCIAISLLVHKYIPRLASFITGGR